MGTLTLTGSATVTQYQTALESITFKSTSTFANTRTVSFQVNDGTASSAVAYKTIDLIIVTPTQLVVTAEPPSLFTVGGTFGFTVAAEDGLGRIGTTYSGTATVALDNNPGGGVLGGTLTASIVNGVAVFSGLSINQAGSGYTLQITSSGLTSAVTNAFSVIPGPVITPNTSALIYGVQTGTKAIAPSLTLTDTGSSTIASATVTITSGYVSTEDDLFFTAQNGITGNFMRGHADPQRRSHGRAIPDSLGIGVVYRHREAAVVRPPNCDDYGLRRRCVELACFAGHRRRSRQGYATDGRRSHLAQSVPPHPSA